MSDPNSQFDRLLETFPLPVRDNLRSIPPNSGKLAAGHCRAVMQTLEISPQDLMLRLLPLAGLYAAAKISGFKVGAVAKARLADGSSDFALFFGANIEFTGQALMQTIHAEQAAIMNAWLQGAVQIDAIAVSAAPCGYCRQILYELEASRSLTVIIQKPDGEGVTMARLSDLLPEPFGPHDLKVTSGLMASPGRLPNLSLKRSSNDPLVLEALAAAMRSYAPYSHNLAGCAIQQSDGKIHAGRYAENAAFNPSLSPLHTAVIRMNMDQLAPHHTITRAVLVERPTSSGQRGVAELLLRTLAPDIRLEYFEAL